MPDEINELIEKTGEEESLEYLIASFPGYTRFRSLTEFEEYRDKNSTEEAVKERTVFDEYSELLDFARQELAAERFKEGTEHF